MFLDLFLFLTQLLISKHLKTFSTHRVGRNGTMWKTCFSAPQNTKKKISWNIKTKCVTELLTVRSSSVKDYNCLYVVSTQKTNVYINFNKNNGNLEIFCWQITVYLNPRKSFPICMFVVMASENCDFHIHFTFLQEF